MVIIQRLSYKQCLTFSISLFLVTYLAGYAKCEVYNLRPLTNNSESCSMEDSLTLFQFVDNYIKNDTSLTLIFASGNHTLDSEIIFENINSLSMLFEFTSSLALNKAMIVCSHHGRFEFRNVSIVSVRNIDFVGCTGNKIIYVSQFMVENSHFYGQGKANRTMLILSESSAILRGVTFINHYLEISSEFEEVNDIILCNMSDFVIAQAVFQGNSVDFGSLLHGMLDSQITIYNTTFKHNHANSHCFETFSNSTHTYRECKIGYILSLDYSSSMRVYYSNFEDNKGSVVLGFGNITISHSLFICNSAMYWIRSSLIFVSDTNLTISNAYFFNNTEQLIEAIYSNIYISNNKFVSNTGILNTYHGESVYISNSEFVRSGEILNAYSGDVVIISHCTFTNGSQFSIIYAWRTNIIITHNDFINNTAASLLYLSGNVLVSISYSEFINNIAFGALINCNVDQMTIVQSKLKNNHADNLVAIYGDLASIKLSEFINNQADFGIVNIPYHSTAASIYKNRFTDNSAIYGIFIGSNCKPGFSLSLSSSRCIQCPTTWRQNLVGIILVAVLAGILLVTLVLVLNMTVAVGTLNGILFYANIVAVNADTYFSPFFSSNFATVFISWLNLDIGFDVCFFDGMDDSNKALLQLAFPAYIIFLVIIVIIMGECSSKFAKIIGKGNPVAALATMILFSYTKFFDAIARSAFLLYLNPTYGSSDLDVTKLNQALIIEKRNYSLLVLGPILFLLGVLYTILIFSWQWLLQFQNRAIFKWVKYQKLHHFMEPYHTPYTARYRYWTGLLLLVRVLLLVISIVNFPLDPRLHLLLTISIIGFLILMKAVTAKRVYKNRVLDVLETSIYFNIVIFSAVTFYTFESGGNQPALAYTSVVPVFILFLAVIIFHSFRYTRLYKYFLVQKAFKKISSVVIEKTKKQDRSDNVPQELDGFQLERADVQEQPTVTHSVVEISQSST